LRLNASLLDQYVLKVSGLNPIVVMSQFEDRELF